MSGERLDAAPNPPHYPQYNYNNLDRVRCLRTALAARNQDIDKLQRLVRELQDRLEGEGHGGN